MGFYGELLEARYGVWWPPVATVSGGPRPVYGTNKVHFAGGELAVFSRLPVTDSSKCVPDNKTYFRLMA